MRNIRVIGLMVSLALAVTGCATPVSPAPTSAPATIPASPRPTPTQAPTSPPDAIEPAPTYPPASPLGTQRLAFGAGGSSASVEGTLSEGGKVTYLVSAGAGQAMVASMLTTNDVLGMSISSPGGSALLKAADRQLLWRGVLPQTGDYAIDVTWLTGGPVPATYTLRVSIPPRAAPPAECWVTTGQATQRWGASTTGSVRFGVAPAGVKAQALARTTDHWLGFDDGLAFLGAMDLGQLRWYQTAGNTFSFDPPGCDQALPVAMSLQSMENSTYHVLGKGDVTLTNRTYINPDFTAALTGTAIHETSLGYTVFGDLNGDGDPDAVSVLVTDMGGSESIVEIVPVLNMDGHPQPGEGVLVGDRTPVNGITIQDGLVTAAVVVLGKGDMACCPNHPQTWTLKLVDGALVKQ